MADLGFFYGTLMTGFDRRRRLGIDAKMAFRGRGWIRAALFDLGLYPAAVPDEDSRVWGEVFELKDSPAVLAALDEMEGYSAEDPDTSLYIRRRVARTSRRRHDRGRVGLFLQRAARPRARVFPPATISRI